MPTYKKNTTNYTSINGRWTNDKIDEVQRQRAMGLYTTEDTRDESIKAFMNMKKNDTCITLLHSRGVYNVYDMHEFMEQMLLWKTQGVSVHDYNVMELTINSKRAYLLIAQPKSIYEDKPEPGVNVCPLAMCYGMLVSGFAYIFKKKCDVELVLSYMKSK